MRLGIFGGTFDPVHLGHLRTAVEIADELALEKVYLIPSAQPPHKTLGPVASFKHRVQMLNLALGQAPFLAVLDLEGKRAGPSYTIDTLREIHSTFEEELDLFFILGLDAFMEITSWKEYRDLFDYAHFVIIHREGTAIEPLRRVISEIGIGIRERDEGGQRFLAPSGKSLFLMETTRMEISSTGIRKAIGAGKSISFLVPGSVEKYIFEKALY